MLNHSDIIWRYADALARQADFDGLRRSTPPVLSALAAPRTTRRRLRVLGFR